MTDHELNTRTEATLEALRCEFTGKVSAERVTQIGWDGFHELHANATIDDYIPLLVYRQTRETLLAIARDDLHNAA